MFKSLKKKEEAKKLISQGHFDLARKQYGKRIYKNALIDLKYNEIKETKGIKAARRYKISNSVKFTISNLMPLVASAYITLQGTTEHNIISDKRNNAIKYQKEIEDYNLWLEKKAKYYASFNLTDLELMTAITIDMYENTGGYGLDEDEIKGFLGISMMDGGQNAHGVCRNMACYGADLINKIGELTGKEYNARVACGKAEFSDLEQADSSILKIYNNKKSGVSEITNEESEVEDNKEDEEYVVFTFDVEINHAVIMLDAENEKLPIIWDITNMLYAQRENENKIKSFNNTKKFKEQGTFEINELVSFMMYRDGIGELPDAINDYFEDKEDTGYTDKEIENMYGIEAQKKAINTWREKKKQYENNKRNEFLDSLKVAKNENCNLKLGKYKEFDNDETLEK